MTLFGITIPACNEQDYIADTLQTLIDQSADNPGRIDKYAYEIVVVESNSDDDTAEVVEEVASGSPVQITLLRGGTASMTAARVLGINYLLERERPPRYLVSGDADTHYPPGWLAGLARELDKGADLVTCAGYMDPVLWQRCPRLTRRYSDAVGTIFFDPQTRSSLAEHSPPGLFTEQVYTAFGRPMCEAGFAIDPRCYLDLGGFRPDCFVPDSGRPLLHERFPLMFGAALAGYHVAQLQEPWWSTSPRRLVGEPEIQFGQEFVQTEMRQHRGISDEAYAALDGQAATIDFGDLRFNCVLDYIVLPCVTRPHLVRRNRAYFGTDWRPLISAIHRWLASHPEPEPRQLVGFALDLAGQYAERIIERLRQPSCHARQAAAASR